MSLLGAVRAASVAAILYVAVWLMLSPPPIGSLTALIGGLLGLWIAGPRRAIAVIAGAALGLAVGVAMHARVHVVEGRWDEFLWAHAIADASVGAALSGAILVAIVVMERRITRRGAPGPAR